MILDAIGVSHIRPASAAPFLNSNPGTSARSTTASMRTVLEIAVRLHHYHYLTCWPRAGAASGNADRKQSSMSTSAGSELNNTNMSHHSGAKKLALIAVKLLVTGACFWYLWRQIDVSDVLSAIPLLDFRWVAFATLMIVLEIPLLALRWSNVVAALAARNERMTQTVMIAITSIGQFFAQVLPSMAGDGVRAWLLARLDSSWSNAVTSVVIDRAIGAGVLIAMGFAILLLPSGLAAFGGYRHVVLLVYGGLLFAGGAGLLLAPTLASLFARWRYSRWLAGLTMNAHRVVLGRRGVVVLAMACLLHLLTIAAVGPWGARKVCFCRSPTRRCYSRS
jgi:hypothetical protein